MRLTFADFLAWGTAQRVGWVPVRVKWYTSTVYIQHHIHSTGDEVSEEVIERAEAIERAVRELEANDLKAAMALRVEYGALKELNYPFYTETMEQRARAWAKKSKGKRQHYLATLSYAHSHIDAVVGS